MIQPTWNGGLSGRSAVATNRWNFVAHPVNPADTRAKLKHARLSRAVSWSLYSLWTSLVNLDPAISLKSTAFAAPAGVDQSGKESGVFSSGDIAKGHGHHGCHCDPLDLTWLTGSRGLVRWPRGALPSPWGSGKAPCHQRCATTNHRILLVGSWGVWGIESREMSRVSRVSRVSVTCGLAGWSTVGYCGSRHQGSWTYGCTSAAMTNLRCLWDAIRHAALSCSDSARWHCPMMSHVGGLILDDPIGCFLIRAMIQRWYPALLINFSRVQGVDCPSSRSSQYISSMFHCGPMMLRMWPGERNINHWINSDR